MTDLFLPEPNKSTNQSPKLGILLLNLGSPDQPIASSLRRYLNEFLSDQRVIELSPLKWQPILKLIILPFRSPKSAKKYQKIWLAEGAPLRVYTEQLSHALQKNIADPSIVIDFAMTYGAPTVESVIQKMKEQGVSRLLTVPLFPQYAGSSTGAALDVLYSALKKQRNIIDITTLSRFFDHPAYIQTIVNNIQTQWKTHGKSEHLLLSFHGVPVATIEKGDPYFDECHHSAKLITSALNLKETDYSVCFQSRFGNDKWLQPSTQTLLDELPKKGVKSVDIICPVFICDCLETLEEIAIEGKKSFEAAGGKSFHYIPCPNAQAHWVDALHKIITPYLQK